MEAGQTFKSVGVYVDLRACSQFFRGLKITFINKADLLKKNEEGLHFNTIVWGIGSGAGSGAATV